MQIEKSICSIGWYGNVLEVKPETGVVFTWKISRIICFHYSPSFTQRTYGEKCPSFRHELEFWKTCAGTYQINGHKFICISLAIKNFAISQRYWPFSRNCILSWAFPLIMFRKCVHISTLFRWTLEYCKYFYSILSVFLYVCFPLNHSARIFYLGTIFLLEYLYHAKTKPKIGLVWNEPFLVKRERERETCLFSLQRCVD